MSNRSRIFGKTPVARTIIDDPLSNIGEERRLSSTGTPTADFNLDTSLVYRLLAGQHADLIHLPIRPLEAGWDNAMFRLGDHLTVRLPRRSAAATLIDNEQTWLPLLAEHLPIPIPVPIRMGRPAHGYPWRWSVLPWLNGNPADQDEPHANQAHPFATFLRALHRPAPSNAPLNAVRGIPLSRREAVVEERMGRIKMKTDLITPAITKIWLAALHAPVDVPAMWLHGDLHARNVLVENGSITGIIDWGDITSGDVATDLASLWMLFSDQQARQQAIAEYGPVSDPTLRRAKGWAILFAIMLLDSGLVDNPRNAVMGERTLRRISGDT